MPRGKVAENNNVRRVSGVVLRMNSIILAKTEIEHFIGLVEDDSHQFEISEIAAPQVIAQSPGVPTTM